MSPSSPTPPNRKLKITILTAGSRGDVQRYCALGIGLKRAGHEVTVAANENLSGDKGTILVVDDEASIRRILQTRLEMIGYSSGYS